VRIHRYVIIGVDIMRIKIISGGQTGADLGGLIAAKAHGVETGGCAAKGYVTENGVNNELKTVYGLVDKGLDYVERTKENVKNSDVTLIFADKMMSAGTKLTVNTCKEHKKKFLQNPAAYEIEKLITKMSRILDEDAVFVINVAGNRESVAPGVCARTSNVVSHALCMAEFMKKTSVKK
jgi:hypothetical protein